MLAISLWDGFGRRGVSINCFSEALGASVLKVRVIVSPANIRPRCVSMLVGFHFTLLGRGHREVCIDGHHKNSLGLSKRNQLVKSWDNLHLPSPFAFQMNLKK